MTDRISQTRIVREDGFTLTELAIVLIIVALLIGGLTVSLSASRDIANEKETQKQLALINEALLGFAAGQSRLPCPATAGSNGRETFCTNALPAACGAELYAAQPHGRCADFFNAFVPAATLGLSPTDDQGFAIDAWGNPIRYVITNANNNAFTTIDGLKTAWSINPAAILPDLRVCNTAANIAADDCPAADQLTNSAVAVVFSTGINGAIAPTTADELANWTTSNDRVFVSATPGPTFDDLIIWISPNILYNRMIAAGRLP